MIYRHNKISHKEKKHLPIRKVVQSKHKAFFIHKALTMKFDGSFRKIFNFIICFFSFKDK